LLARSLQVMELHYATALLRAVVVNLVRGLEGGGGGFIAWPGLPCPHMHARDGSGGVRPSALPLRPTHHSHSQPNCLSGMAQPFQNVNLAAPELAFVLRDSGTQLLVTAAELAPLAAAALAAAAAPDADPAGPPTGASASATATELPLPPCRLAVAWLVDLGMQPPPPPSAPASPLEDWRAGLAAAGVALRCYATDVAEQLSIAAATPLDPAAIRAAALARWAPPADAEASAGEGEGGGSSGQPCSASGWAAPGAPLQAYYTSGTTGRPKGVLLSHRVVVLHALGTVAGAAQGGRREGAGGGGRGVGRSGVVRAC
jgi:non-ribosomal peptide synthetase component F